MAVSKRIAEIEDKIAQQQQKSQQIRTQGADTGLQTRLVAVMDESLARAKTHLEYIAQRGASKRARRAKAHRSAAS